MTGGPGPTRETWSSGPAAPGPDPRSFAEQVRVAALAWRFVADDAEVHAGEDYTLVRGPDWLAEPLELTVRASGRPVSEALAEALDRAAATGLPEVVVRVGLAAPEELTDRLVELGGTVVETCDVLALDLAAGVPDLAVPAGLEVRWVGDPQTMAAHYAVNTAVFGGAPPPRGRLCEEAAQATVDQRHGHGGVVLVSRRGQVVGSAGLSRVGHVSRLWGGAVLPEARGIGAYRALLATRLAYGLAHGGPLALVRARVGSSGPVLSRAGFTAHGQELGVAVPLSR